MGAKIKTIKIDGMHRAETILLWTFLGFVAVFVLSRQLVSGNPNDWVALGKFLAGLAVAGVVGALLLWGSDVLFGTKLYYNGKEFLIGSETSNDSFTPGDIAVYRKSKLSQPPRARLTLKTGREISILPPLWLLKADSKEKFCSIVEKKHSSFKK